MGPDEASHAGLAHWARPVAARRTAVASFPESAACGLVRFRPWALLPPGDGIAQLGAEEGGEGEGFGDPGAAWRASAKGLDCVGLVSATQSNIRVHQAAPFGDIRMSLPTTR